MPDEHQWQLYFNSEPIRVRQAVRDILLYMDKFLPELTQDERWEYRLILSELLFNAVIHGNGSDAAKQVHVSVRVGRRFVTVSVTDEGDGYDYRKIIESARLEESTYKESGRGIRLVLALADQVRFSRSGRRVTFTKRIRRPDHG